MSSTASETDTASISSESSGGYTEQVVKMGRKAGAGGAAGGAGGTDKQIEEKYKKHTLLTHIREIPDTYIGSIEPHPLTTYLYVPETQRFAEETISYVPGFYKIFDEVLVNALDQVARLTSDIQSGKTDVRPVKTIKVAIDRVTGWITVTNDGDGIDVEKHSGYDNIWIPELIFGELLTGTNYDTSEERLWGGKNGYGAKLANIFSKEFIVETIDHRRKKMYSQRFYDNMEHRDKATVKAASKAPYTTVKFLPDYARFGMKGMDADTVRLFERRVYDACATTPATVAVYFNEAKLDIKDFEKYADLFIGTKDEKPRATESQDRWEVLATVSDDGQFHQVSFANGINTLKGGRHVDYITNQITKKLVEIAASKKKKEIKPQHIKDNLWVFVKASIVNPAFDSQTKENLTTQVTKFGSKCELSDKFFDKLIKTGILDKAVSLTEFHEKKKFTKSDGKKTSRIFVPKLDDANDAGTKNSRHCTLILTEGDSAKSMAIAGLSVVGRDRYGVFPLRGKILNVKDVATKKIMENEEITNIKKILGLTQGKEYSSVDDLRYGKIMIMTDQDTDGYHIRGLLFNVFQTLWPSLFKMPDFLTSMLTPIVKVSHTNGTSIEFHNLTDYEHWKKKTSEGATGLRGWTIKYYKGLGTSTAEEAKKYFKDLKMLEYTYKGKTSDEGIDLAFNKSRADDRKEWLTKTYDRNRVLDYSKKQVPFETFVNDELIHFSNYDLERSIPCMVDGLKVSTRKVLFGCFKKKLYTREIRVSQLSGYISEHAMYHHGETSLQQAIIGMAQDFVGANNIHYLQPNGQFGTRIQGGKDSASPRYIHTLLSPMARKIYREADAPILNYLDDDGVRVEPDYYVPIVPAILVNGGLGIGTGFSTNIPCHNPSDIIHMCRTLIRALDAGSGVAIDTKADLERANDVMAAAPLAAIHPWYLGFKGTISETKPGVYQSTGVWKWLDDERLEITELPVGTWTEDYKEFLTAMVAEGSPVLRDFESHYTEHSVHFILHFYAGVRKGVEQNLETEFKLVSSKNLNMNNVHLFDRRGVIHKYGDAVSIVRDWAVIRLEAYLNRKKHQLGKMEAEYRVLSAKVRFILDVISGKVNLMNQKMKDIEAQLVALKYPKLYVAEKTPVIASDADADAAETDETAVEGPADYEYLVRMPMKQLTLEKKQQLEKEAKNLEEAIKVLRETPIQRIWERELDELSEDWETYKASHTEHQVSTTPAVVPGKLKKTRAVAPPKAPKAEPKAKGKAVKATKAEPKGKAAKETKAEPKGKAKAAKAKAEPKAAKKTKE